MQDLKDRIQAEIDTALEAGHPFQHASEMLMINCGYHATRDNADWHIRAVIEKAFADGQPLAKQIDRLNSRIKKAVIAAVEAEFQESLN